MFEKTNNSSEVSLPSRQYIQENENKTRGNEPIWGITLTPLKATKQMATDYNHLSSQMTRHNQWRKQSNVHLKKNQKLN